MANNFDLLRLVLSFSVFMAHWNILTVQNLSNKLFHLSHYGVDMFFIVSGFLIFWSYENNQNKKDFYIKRFFRIFPLYGILIVLQTLFFILYSNGTTTEIVKYFISNILFLNFLSYSVGDIFNHLEVNAINGSLWTLKNEIVFYLLVPLLYKLYKKYGYTLLVSLYILSVAYISIVDYLHIDRLLVQFPAQLRLFLSGIILYLLMNKLNNKSIGLIAIISFVLITLFYDESFFSYSIYPLLLALIVVYLVYFTKVIKISFDFSYSFYILHFPVIQLILYFNINPENPIISFVSIMTVILILSYFSEKYIEKKFIKIGKNIISRK